MKKARSSLVIIGALALITFALVAGVLAAAQMTTYDCRACQYGPRT